VKFSIRALTCGKIKIFDTRELKGNSVCRNLVERNFDGSLRNFLYHRRQRYSSCFDLIHGGEAEKRTADGFRVGPRTSFCGIVPEDGDVVDGVDRMRSAVLSTRVLDTTSLRFGVTNFAGVSPKAIPSCTPSIRPLTFDEVTQNIF
jgi:hypothetical protein